MDAYRKQLFDEEAVKLIKKKTVLSVGHNQYEIIQGILDLHCNGKSIDCDPTYSRGNFYKHGIEKPRYCFDLKP